MVGDNYDEAFNAIVNEYSSRIEVKSLTYCAGAPDQDSSSVPRKANQLQLPGRP